MTATATKTNYPDYREYGLYLLPRNQHTQYGFSETQKPGRCLLLLDTKSSITPKTAKQARLKLLLQNKDKSISLYIVLPTMNRRKLYEYPDQSELLQQLELAYVARNQVITPLEITQQFRSALGDLKSDVSDLLDFSVAIGVNHNGDTVYNSTYGRFVERKSLNENGETVVERLRANLVPLAECLYARNSDGEVNLEALALCVTAYLETCSEHMQSTESAQSFAQTIFQIPPKDAPFKKSLDVAESIVRSVLNESTELDINHWHEFNNLVIVNEAIDLYNDTLEAETYLEVFDKASDRHNNRHSMHFPNDSITLYKPAITVLLAPILARLLLPDDNIVANKIVYSPSIGDGTILSGFTTDLSFHINEPGPQNYYQLSLFVEEATRLNTLRAESETDPVAVPSYFITNKDLSLIAPASDFSLSIALLPAGVSPLTTNIPFNDNHGNRYLERNTDRLDQSLIIEVLEQRQSEGRSLFLGPIEPNQVGKIGKRSVHLLKWLQAYFFNVSVVDLSSTLFNQNTLPSANRLYIVGNKKPKPDNLIALQDRISHLHKDFHIPLITSYEQLIELEQAISLIERSKRIPVSDADITDMPLEVDVEADADDDATDIDRVGTHFVDGFYNLNPTTAAKLSEDTPPEVSSTEQPTELAISVEPAAIEDAPQPTPQPEDKVLEDDSQGIPASSNDTDDGADNESGDSSDDDSPRVVFQDFSDYSDSDDSLGDDDTGLADNEEPDAGDFDLDILTGGDAAADAKMAAITSAIENNYMDGDNVDVLEVGNDSDDSDDSDDSQEAPGESDNSDEQSNEALVAANSKEALDGSLEPPTDDAATTLVDLSKPESSPSSVASKAASLDSADDDTTLTTSYYTPRFIDDPNLHLIKHSGLKAQSPNKDYTFHANFHEGADVALAHKLAKLKNQAMLSIADQSSLALNLHRLTSLTLAETHLPAIVISYNHDIETMQVLTFIDYADSFAYEIAVEEFNKEHRMPGDAEDSMVIHEMFSLRSAEHNQEVKSLPDVISAINDWLPDAIPSLNLDSIYKYDAHTFGELYRLAATHHTTSQSETRAHSIKSIKHLISNGSYREKEYHAWWWMRLDDSSSKLFALNKNPSAPNASLFSPYTPAILSPSNEDFELLASQMIDLVRTNVYSKEFPLGVIRLSRYLVSQESLPQLITLTDFLQRPKSISFYSLISSIVSCHAICIAGVYRFFTQNCPLEDRDVWLGRLNQAKDLSFTTEQDSHSIARLALDVNYSRSLLKSPTTPFVSSAPPLTRYMSESTNAQSFSLIKRDQQPQIHNALLQMQTMWASKSQDFDMTSWLILETLSDVKSLPSEQVDLLFLATTNVMARRTSYFSVAGLADALATLIPLLHKIARALDMEAVVCSAALPADVEACCRKNNITTYSPYNLPPAGATEQLTVYLNPHTELAIKNASIVLCDDSFEQLVDESLASALLKNGQALSLYKPVISVQTRLMPSPANRSVLADVYEQYTRIFDAMRQLKVLSVAITHDFFKSHLDNEHRKLEECSPLRWWFNNQSSILHRPTDDNKAAYNNILKELQQKVRTNDEDLALKVISNKTPLHLPNILSCDVDAWIDALSSRLALALSTPQIITEAIDSIKNGIQPILIFNQEQEALLHHVIVVEQGATLPLSYFTLHKRAITNLENKPNKTPEEIARLESLVADLSKGLIRRDSEVNAIFQQNKKLPTPLIKSAIQCFLQEVQQFALTDITGTTSYVNFAKEQSKRSVSSEAAVAFSQLVNTLIQMSEDSVITDLPLSPIDTIRTQIERHGYQAQLPRSLKYFLSPASKEKNLWALEEPRENTQIDAHFIYAFEDVEPAAIAHKTRHSSLILTSYPATTSQLDLVVKSARSLKPIAAVANTVYVNLTDTLCQADVQRQPIIGEYISRQASEVSALYAGSDTLAAKYYMATAPEYIDRNAKNADLISFLGLVSQLPLLEQERHLTFFNVRRQVQRDYDSSKLKRRATHLHQSVFTRRYDMVSRDDYSLFSHLNKIISGKDIQPSLVKLFSPAKDYIHDTYSQYGYKPVTMDQLNDDIVKLSNKLKVDLFYMVDTHPHKDYLYQMLSDHSQNPEADYFIELEDGHKKAYIYKHLIKDMSHRGIIATITQDLYQHKVFSGFSGNIQIELSSMLAQCQNTYDDIYHLCHQIQVLTGISSYIEQLEAQAQAKHLIIERIDAICLYTPQAETKLNIPVLVCQPKLGLGEVELSKNLPAITSLFDRQFTNEDPVDASIFLGKNEWLITCGISLPHYSQTIDLNNLICHVVTTGADTSVTPALFSTNGRHLYSDYVNKKAMTITQTHVVTQGVLCADLEVGEAGITSLVQVDIDVMPTVNVSTWVQLSNDMTMYRDAFGVALEQVLIGDGVHAQYCLSQPAIFAKTEFHDVAGTLNTAIKMTSYGKSLYTDFNHLFKKILPVARTTYIDYLRRCTDDGHPSLKTGLYCTALQEVLTIAVIHIDGATAIEVGCNAPAKLTQLQQMLNPFDYSASRQVIVGLSSSDIETLLDVLLPKSCWIYIDDARDIDLVQSIISNASSIVRSIESTLEAIPESSEKAEPNHRIEVDTTSRQALSS